MGRPSDFSQEIADEICERTAKGEPLSVICSDEHLPHFSTVYRWKDAQPSFREDFARAREVGTHFLAYDSLRIADDPTIEPADKRIRIDTRLRLAGKWNARAYGEAVQLKHADADGAKLPTPDLSGLSPDQLRALASVKLGGE